MQIDVTKLQYCVTMEPEELLNIIAADEFRIEHGDTLYHRLLKIEGVCDVEYNGMFGPHVWFSVDLGEEVNTEETKRTAFAEIVNYP